MQMVREFEQDETFWDACDDESLPLPTPLRQDLKTDAVHVTGRVQSWLVALGQHFPGVADAVVATGGHQLFQKWRASRAALESPDWLAVVHLFVTSATIGTILRGLFVAANMKAKGAGTFRGTCGIMATVRHRYRHSDGDALPLQA